MIYETVSVGQANEAIEADHRALHALVDQLSQGLDQKRAAAVLESLHARMAAHFLREEQPGGLYDTLGVCVPRLRRPLARLVDDHYRLSATVRDLRERARAPWDATAEMLAADVARLVAALADHERLESALIADAVASEA